ncbi:MAG: Mov34/MPN/PAD-1 family protein [Clostridia bacterium]|nr:Mov34/MPN/PAD-1 family protein [Clostridia bacterium]
MKKKFSNGNWTIEFDDDEFVKIIRKHLKRERTETGGILCGYYSNDFRTAKVTEVCLPTNDSKFGRASFVRGTQGLCLSLSKKWRKGVYYLGEWHLHPFASPNASGQDIKQIIENSQDKNLKCPEPIMIIAGMKEEEYVFKTYVVFSGEAVELLDEG